MIVTLCGSSRFEPWFRAWSDALSMAGHCVRGQIGVRGQVRIPHKSEMTKLALCAHDMNMSDSDAIFVVNAFAYIGEGTYSDIEYAKENDLRIIYMNSWGLGCGYDEKHESKYLVAADAYGVLGEKSPVDTSLSPGPWDGSLLGPAGKRRMFIANMVEDAVSAAIGGMDQVVTYPILRPRDISGDK